MIEGMTIPSQCAAALDALAAEIGATRESVIVRILDAALENKARYARWKLGLRASEVRLPLAEIAQCTQDGLTLEQASQRLGVSVNTVWRRYRKLGFTVARKKYRHPREDAILAALRDGLTGAPEIGARVGCTRNCASMALVRLEELGKVRRAGYVMRARGRPAVRWRLGPALEAAQ